ncbi:MAG: hypothetical protein AAFX99_29315 [Myxococcota bacterium]
MVPRTHLDLDDWLDRILHDLVKYLEMMPRSLDWTAALDDDDLDCVWESIVETRTGRDGTLSAQQIWEQAVVRLPPELRQRAEIVQVDGYIATLVAQSTLIEEGGVVDQEQLFEALFGVGRCLRALREG